MSKQPTPEEIEAAAAEDVQAADTALVALEERVLADDQDVTPAEIEAARSQRHFAGLRQKAAVRKATQLRETALAAEQDKAITEARKILAEADDGTVEAAEKAAGEAMVKLRATVRARNEARERALKRLQDSPVPMHNPEPGQQRKAPAFGHGRMYDAREVLWIDGKGHPVLDEDQVMDRARRHPAALDDEAKRAEQQAAMARVLEADTTRYREDRAAFNAMPAARRKRVIDALGLDWEQHVAELDEAAPHPYRGM